MPFKDVAARLEVRVRAGEDEFAVHRLIGVLDFKRKQAAFLVEEQLGIVGRGLEDRAHDLEEFVGLVELGGGQARPHRSRNSEMLSCGTTGWSATSCFTSEGERLVCTG